MAALNYAELYQQGLDQPFREKLVFGDFYNSLTPAPSTQTSHNNVSFKYEGAKTIHIQTISTGGMVDYDRDSTSGAASRNYDNAWEAYTLQYERKYKTSVDPIDVDETAMGTTLSNITQVFNAETKIPELNRTFAAAVASQAAAIAAGSAVVKPTISTTAITKANVVTELEKAIETLQEASVGEDNCILYMNVKTFTLLKSSPDIARRMGATENAFGRTVATFDGFQIRTVPTNLFKTTVALKNDGTPATDGVDAKEINFMFAHKSAILWGVKYESVKIDPASALSDNKAIYLEVLYHGVNILKNKANGIYINHVGS